MPDNETDNSMWEWHFTRVPFSLDCSSCEHNDIYGDIWCDGLRCTVRCFNCHQNMAVVCDEIPGECHNPIDWSDYE
jgi:hypothetical protein